jgi:phytoene/squalene synthetase
MPKAPMMDPETAIESTQKAVDIALEAQEKAEETYKQAIEDLFDAAQSTLRQTRSTLQTMTAANPMAAAARPAIDQLFEMQEKTIDSSRAASKTAFDNYRRNVAEPVRKLARESVSKLAVKNR